MEIQIIIGTIQEVVELSLQLPEFINPHGIDVYKNRLKGKSHLILLAQSNGVNIGFKVGYGKEDTFYSWMGGVLPKYRHQGVASNLAEYQEEWAKINGFNSITFKTRNRLKPMLLFSIQNGFDIVDFQERESVAENRIILKKEL